MFGIVFFHKRLFGFKNLYRFVYCAIFVSSTMYDIFIGKALVINMEKKYYYKNNIFTEHKYLNCKLILSLSQEISSALYLGNNILMDKILRILELITTIVLFI